MSGISLSSVDFCVRRLVLLSSLVLVQASSMMW